MPPSKSHLRPEIRRLYAEGLSANEVARIVGCSNRTVKDYCADILRNRVAANATANRKRTKPESALASQYRQRRERGRTKQAHRLIAERALGRPLRGSECVHHADGSRSINAPLVICPDQGYHSLLHVRTRVLQAGGDPNTQRLCGSCGLCKPFTAFKARHDRPSGLESQCRDCRNGKSRHRWEDE